jgi:GntR family transcriptional regulator
MKAQVQIRSGVVAQPLYAQVRERLLQRIVGKEWQHGQLLPNEFELASQFGVSIGTVRKAVEGLEAAKMVVRKQGRGTYVTRDSHMPQAEPVSWFADAGVEPVVETPTTLAVEQRAATVQERAALMLQSDEAVIFIRRRRAFTANAFVFDRIALPQRLFFDLEPGEPLPTNLYEFYGDYFGVRAVKCHEKVSVTLATDDVCATVGVPTGTPVLKIERTAYSASGEAMEWRESFCNLPKGLNFSGAC